ncbi:MAG: serine hydrolase domain-containing protein [Chthoniobacteraceae bacterium]
MNFSAPRHESAQGSLVGRWRRLRARAWALGALSVALLAGGDVKAADEKPVAPGLPDALETIRAKYQLPALAAAAVQGVKILESGAVGVRRVDAPVKVTIDDRWHIGSCTKSMTATLAAMFVERGEMKWTSTVGETFPELHDTMDPQWTSVTLEQLLTHRAGAPAAAPENLWRNAQTRQGTATEQRLQFVRGLLLHRPETPPGTAFVYSNQGYAIAGAMLERVSSQPWETLMSTMLFPACVMPNAGFGEPATRGKIDQPWGHARSGEKLVPVPPGPQADNPPAIGPAGTVHCTIEELARYAAWHARGERTGTASLKKESFVKLHTAAAGGDYAMGWKVLPRGWAGGNALTHNGSNTMFFSVIWIAPAKDIAFVAATNCAGEEAAKGCDEAVALLLSRLPK